MRALKKRPFEIRFDTAFGEVIQACAAREDVWITDEIREAYRNLHEAGLAHSVECWDKDGLQGGLYGVSIRKAFFGESMFHRKTDASKIALVALVSYLRGNGFLLLDTQWITDHLRQFGTREVSRRDYLHLLRDAMDGLYEELGIDFETLL